MGAFLSSRRASVATRGHCRQSAAALLFRLTLIATLFGVTVSALAQSQPTARSTASPQAAPTVKRSPDEITAPTGSIKGRVVSDDGRPVVNATLMAQAVTGPTLVKPARVDSEGKFSFDDLPPAGYLIVAVAPGYIDESLTGDSTQWPRHLIGAQLKITLIKGGVITGKVTTSKGDPIVGIPVHAVALNNPSSSANLLGAGVGESDDRGIYRIYGLRPGQYVINAGGSSGQFGLSVSSGFDLDAPTYYPSSTRDTAIPIDVRSGEETTGIDIKYQGAEGHRVSGNVLGTISASSASNGAIVITLSPAGTQSVVSMAIASAADKRRAFGFNGVADGEYDLLTAFQTGQQGDASLVATKRVTVRGEDVTGVELTLTQLASIAGSITLDPIKPENSCDRRGSQLTEITLNPRRDDPRKSGSQTMTAMLAGVRTSLNAKGEFNARNLEAGRYRLEIKLPTEAWYVRAINLPAAVAATGQQQPASLSSQPSTPEKIGPSWQGTVTIRPSQQISGVSIMLGQDAAGLRGHVVVTPEGSAIPANLHVHLVPADREQINDVLHYGETMILSDGSFEFLNVAPGRYFVVSRIEPATETALTSPRPLAWDPAVRAKLRQDADAANIVVDLKPCQQLNDYALAQRTGQ